MQTVIAVGSLLLGVPVGYLVGAFIGCEVLYPESNLCGLVGVFWGAPIGGVIGVATAIVLWLRRRRPEA